MHSWKKDNLNLKNSCAVPEIYFEIMSAAQFFKGCYLVEISDYEYTKNLD